MFVQLKKRKVVELSNFGICTLDRILEYKPVVVEAITTYDEAVRAYGMQADGCSVCDELMRVILELSSSVKQAVFVYDRTDEGSEMRMVAEKRINEIVVEKLSQVTDYVGATEILIGIPNGFGVEELVNGRRLELSENFRQARDISTRCKDNPRLYNLAWNKMTDFGKVEIENVETYDDAKFYYDRCGFNNSLMEVVSKKLIEMGKIKLDQLPSLVNIIHFYKVVQNESLKLIIRYRIKESINNLQAVIWVLKQFRDDELFNLIYPKFLEFVDLEFLKPSVTDSYRDIYFLAKKDTRQKVLDNIKIQSKSFDWLIRFYKYIEPFDRAIAEQLNNEIMLLGKSSISMAVDFSEILDIYRLTVDFAVLHSLAFEKMLDSANTYSDYSKIYYLTSPNSERRKKVYSSMDEIGKIELASTNDSSVIAKLLRDSVIGSEMRFLAAEKMVKVIKLF